MSRFYLVGTGSTCHSDGCEKMATHKVMRSGNVDYGSFCKVHAKRKQKSLEAYYKEKEA